MPHDVQQQTAVPPLTVQKDEQRDWLTNHGDRTKFMNFKDAQYDMRDAYFGGALGVLVSGLVWLISGTAVLAISTQSGILSLFFGGMLIYPLSMLLSKMAKRTGKQKPENPLGPLAIESTMLLFIGLFIAFSVSFVEQEWFFAIMLLTIGGRYLLFSTIYGMRIYWVLGGVLAAVGALGLILRLPATAVALAGGFVEILFSAIIFNIERNSSQK